jgi:RNA polymerase sigma factor (sigma-70 family)
MNGLNTHTTDTFISANGQVVRYEDIFDGIAAFILNYSTKGGSYLSSEDMEDLFQTACMKAIISHKSYNPSICSPRTFGSRIAENCAKDFFRKTMRRKSFFTSLEAMNQEGDEYVPKEILGYRGDEFETDREILFNEAAAYMDKKVKSLNANHQYVLELKASDKKPMEMAEMMDCTPSAASTLLHRARVALKKELGDEFTSEFGLCA